MREHPILFSAPMVRAILSGAKTQTRRLITPSTALVNGSPSRKEDWPRLDFNDAFVDAGPSPAGNPGPYLKVARPDDGTRHRVYPRVQPGDSLWVRERCWVDKVTGAFRWYDRPDVIDVQRERDGVKLRPSIHMPRRDACIFREVTGLRVERLQAVSGTDACAEGIDLDFHDSYVPSNQRGAFRRLWESINGAGSWDANPWVWVIEFRRIP